VAVRRVPRCATGPAEKPETTMITPPDGFTHVAPRQRHLTATPMLATLIIAVVALIGSSQALAATTTRPPAASYLFSIPTSSGSLTGSGGHHRLKLRLTGARDYLTQFTDRPLRQAFVVANTDFASQFKTYFATSNPNAVLTYTPTGDRVPVSIVLTIAHPRWNARRHTWTFSATRIRKQPDNLPGSTRHIKPPFIRNPRSFTDATLLIDDSTECDLRPGAQCVGAILTYRNLTGADLEDINLTRATLVYATLTGANLAFANFSHAGLNGDSLANANLRGANFSYADLSGTDLRGATLGGVAFSYAILERANLSNDNLTGENFTSANLAGTNLSNANLEDARLTGASLVGANLENANLTAANLTFANLSNADLTGANVTGANLNALFCNTQMPDGSVNNSGC
jgi:uncharacterized protein YjbI with pentapeptide repeats